MPTGIAPTDNHLKAIQEIAEKISIEENKTRRDTGFRPEPDLIKTLRAYEAQEKQRLEKLAFIAKLHAQYLEAYGDRTSLEEELDLFAELYDVS